MKKKIKEYVDPGVRLCGRCEHRARAIETGHGPRMECHTLDHQSHSCYMYMPTLPAVLKADTGERRPLFAGAMFAGRAHATATLRRDKDVVLRAIKVRGKGVALTWVPAVPIEETKKQ